MLGMISGKERRCTWSTKKQLTGILSDCTVLYVIFRRSYWLRPTLGLDRRRFRITVFRNTRQLDYQASAGFATRRSARPLKTSVPPSDFDNFRKGSFSSFFFCDLVNDLFVTANIDLVSVSIKKLFVWILPDLFLTEISSHWIAIARICHMQFSSISIEATLMDVIGMHVKVFGSNDSLKW